MEQNDEQAKEKRSVHRSPGYPVVDLADAIEKIKAVYEKDKRTATSADVIASHLGYSAAKGPGGRAVSALKQYGLLEEASGKYRISDVGYTLAHYGKDSAEWASAANDAARHPTLFRELLEAYPDGLPSDAALRSDLLGRGFNPSAIPEVISIIRNTLSLVDSQQSSYNESRSDIQMATSVQATAVPTLSGHLSQDQQRAQFHAAASGRTPVGSEIPVAKDCVMGVNASGRVTQEGIQKLIAYLGLIKESFPKESDLN